MNQPQSVTLYNDLTPAAAATETRTQQEVDHAFAVLCSVWSYILHTWPFLDGNHVALIEALNLVGDLKNACIVPTSMGGFNLAQTLALKWHDMNEPIR